MRKHVKQMNPSSQLGNTVGIRLKCLQLVSDTLELPWKKYYMQWSDVNSLPLQVLCLLIFVLSVIRLHCESPSVWAKWAINLICQALYSSYGSVGLHRSNRHNPSSQVFPILSIILISYILASTLLSSGCEVRR